MAFDNWANISISYDFPFIYSTQKNIYDFFEGLKQPTPSHKGMSIERTE